jgi:biopolymer transport protein ExbB
MAGVRSLLRILFGWAMVVIVQAAPPPAGPAVSFEGLRAQTKALAAEEAKLAQAREAEFRKQFERQQRLLNEAIAKRNAAEATSNALSRQFDENEIRIADLGKLLKEHEGTLGELFGVTRQIAGDAANTLQQSLITVQLAEAPGVEDRATFLRRLAGAKALPSITELERLWFELQREMTESAKTRRFAAKVSHPDGVIVDSEVVRVGPFTAIADGKYLAYLAGEKALTFLSRQPSGELLDAARDLQRASAGSYVPAVVDPARGALLSLYVARPNVLERIEHGKLVGYTIILVGIVGLLAAVFQYAYLLLTRFAIARQLREPNRPSRNNPLGRVMLAVRGDPQRAQQNPELATLRVSEAVLREVPKLERCQAFLRLAVAAGPLLGLVGTVIGMIITFQAITAAGTSDPRLMANGIGQAMVATVLGLGIAIPLLFVNSGLVALSATVVRILDEHSTMLIADSIKTVRHERDR